MQHEFLAYFGSKEEIKLTKFLRAGNFVVLHKIATNILGLCWLHVNYAEYRCFGFLTKVTAQKFSFRGKKIQFDLWFSC